MERNLYNHIFWYNEYTELWYAIPRDHQMDFFGLNNQAVAISGKDITVLVELIRKPHLLEKLQNQ
jgi:hypothetical protein